MYLYFIAEQKMSPSLSGDQAFSPDRQGCRVLCRDSRCASMVNVFFAGIVIYAALDVNKVGHF